MADGLTLIGFEHSVYTWIARFALAEMDLTADYIEANPFADPTDPVLAAHTPLRRVPVLVDGDMTLTETDAILRYLADLSGGRWHPSTHKAVARMNQTMGIVDADIYPICVRQVFAQGYYHPKVRGQAGDADQLRDGLERALAPLGVLDKIAEEGRQLCPGQLSLADLHLAPMVSYFLRVPAAEDAMARFPALAAWWEWIKVRPALRATDPMALL